jgi:hypothetical protein
MAGGDDALSAAHLTKGCGGFHSQFPRLGCDEVCNLVGFEMTPHVFDRVELRRIGWQPLNLDAAPGGGDEVLDEQAAVNGCAVPEEQQPAGNVPLEVFEKFDDLGAFDAPGMNLKVEPP